MGDGNSRKPPPPGDFDLQPPKKTFAAPFQYHNNGSSTVLQRTSTENSDDEPSLYALNKNQSVPDLSKGTQPAPAFQQQPAYNHAQHDYYPSDNPYHSAPKDSPDLDQRFNRIHIHQEQLQKRTSNNIRDPPRESVAEEYYLQPYEADESQRNSAAVDQSNRFPNDSDSYFDRPDSSVLDDEEPDYNTYPEAPADMTSKPKKINIPPPSFELLEKLRLNAKKTTDPRVQLGFAKYLIEASTILSNQEPDPKQSTKIKESLLNEAIKWLKKLSNQSIGLGRPAFCEAQFYLANCYSTGALGIPIDLEKAFSLYVHASKQNHREATYRAAVCYELGAGTKKDSHRAVQFFRKAAALGDTAGMYKLGVILLKGLLSQQSNPREAITWLKRAASQADEENPHALHELAICFEKGGIPSLIVDEAYARQLYTRAAQLGYVPSQFKLGCCYEYGTLTCPVDPKRSIAWYTKAAEKEDPESELALSGWYLTGAEGILTQSDTEAYLWARKAADKGLAKAEYAVGYYAELGIGVRQEFEEARRWYMRAAAQGNKRAMQRLAEMQGSVTKKKKGGQSSKESECIIC